MLNANTVFIYLNICHSFIPIYFQNALLQEVCEEWDQCEYKIKEIRGWIEKTRQSLDSPQHRRKPLRDQLGHHEKTLADITIQKTKLRLSIEKLEVIFCCCLFKGRPLIFLRFVICLLSLLGSFSKRYGR